MKICIDPGHGGYDPGAVNHNVGVTEKALAKMFKLDFENAEEQEIKLPTSTGS